MQTEKNLYVSFEIGKVAVEGDTIRVLRGARVHAFRLNVVAKIFT